MSDGKLREIDLFDAATIPALSLDHDSKPLGAESCECDPEIESPVLYIGNGYKVHIRICPSIIFT